MFGDRINRNSWRRIGNTVRGWEAMSRRPQRMQPRKVLQGVGGDTDTYIGQMESDVEASTPSDIKTGTFKVYSFSDDGTQLTDTTETIEDVRNPWPAPIAKDFFLEVVRETTSGHVMISSRPTGVITGEATGSFSGTGSFSIDNFDRLSGIVKYDTPTQLVHNPLGFSGGAGDMVLAEWHDEDAQWNVIQVEAEIGCDGLLLQNSGHTLTTVGVDTLRLTLKVQTCDGQTASDFVIDYVSPETC